MKHDVLRIEELENWSKDEENLLGNTFQKRKQDGFIRECHGDLHLDNMTLIDDHIGIFDCLEFNPVTFSSHGCPLLNPTPRLCNQLKGFIQSFSSSDQSKDLRWTDVICDLAFLVMDLRDRGYSAFARLCLNTYLQRTGDYEGLTLLNYYCVYRALVCLYISRFIFFLFYSIQIEARE